VAAPRDRALDAVRGWCVVSMASAHLALGSTWWSVLHWAGWIDGAVGFVLVSGLVVGITQRRAVRAGGLPAAYRRSGGRALLLWVIHIELCLFALILSAVDPSQSGRLPSAAAEGGWAAAFGKAVTLRINPPASSILALYVVMGAIGMIAVAFLRAGRPLGAVAVSLGIYACAWRFPAQTTFPERAFVPGYVNWAAWQALFVAALVVGWHWDGARLRRIRRSRRWWAGAAVASVALAAGGHAVVHHRAAAGSALQPVLDGLFGNGRLGVGAIGFAFAAVLTLYRGAEAALRLTWGARLLAPLTQLGRRSLDCYVLIAVVALAAPAIAGYRPDQGAGQLVAAAALVGCLAWTAARDAARDRAVGRPVTAAAPASR